MPPKKPQTKPLPYKKGLDQKGLNYLNILFGKERNYKKCAGILWKNWWDPKIPERLPELKAKKAKAKKCNWWFTIRVSRSKHAAYHFLLGNPANFEICRQNLKEVLRHAQTSKLVIFEPAKCDMHMQVSSCIGNCTRCRESATA